MGDSPIQREDFSETKIYEIVTEGLVRFNGHLHIDLLLCGEVEKDSMNLIEAVIPVDRDSVTYDGRVIPGHRIADFLREIAYGSGENLTGNFISIHIVSVSEAWLVDVLTFDALEVRLRDFKWVKP